MKCCSCYKCHSILLQEAKRVSNDSDLQSILADVRHKIATTQIPGRFQQVCDLAMDKTVVYVGKQLLQRNPILLPAVHDYFSECPLCWQLKNMVSALFQSRATEWGGIQNFTIGRGWSAIEDLYTRELSRIKADQCSRVPKLKKSYIIRPQDAPEVELVIEYLEDLNNLFERYIIGKKVRVFDSKGTTI